MTLYEVQCFDQHGRTSGETMYLAPNVLWEWVEDELPHAFLSRIEVVAMEAVAAATERATLPVQGGRKWQE